MLSRLRSRLTYANVTSSLALFLALGGGAAYAVDEWTGANIKNETLTGADVKGKNATSSTPFVEGTLTGQDIRGSRSLNGSLFGTDIANNSLTGADVNESKLGAVPSAENALSLGGTPAAAYGRSFSAASETIGFTDYLPGAGFGLTAPGVGRVSMSCDHGYSSNQDSDDGINEVYFRNESGSPLMVVLGATRIGGGGGAITIKLEDGQGWSLWDTQHDPAPSLSYRLLATPLGGDGPAATFEGGGEQIPVSNVCRGAIQAVKTG